MPSHSNVRIWDLPTRLCHWAMAACAIGALITIKLGGLYLEWHTRFGLALLGLIMFRLVWGFIGPRYARFSNFVQSPRAILNYVRQARPIAGHNPLGALSVILMLLAFGFQASSGLFISDDIMTEGPLYSYASTTITTMLARLHRLNEWPLIALITLHLAAIAWYAVVKRKRLVPAMLTGNVSSTDLPPDTTAAQDGPAIWLRALVLAICCSVTIIWIQNLAPHLAY